MVRLTTEYIDRKCSQALLSKSLSKKIKKQELYNTTHLRMNNNFISSIGNVNNYKNLKVIYLQNNNISSIENLHFASNLTHLYLQHNAIRKMENLDAFGKLQVLYLGYNDIVVVEGLESAGNLTTLDVENQRLSLGESLCFDPRSVHTLSTCLQVLNISGNKMTSLKDVKNLRKLEILDARNNLLEDIDDLTETMSTFISLRDLSLQGNPVTRCYRYKENLIANNDTIRNFNGKTVTDVCRCFMKRFKIEKHLYRKKKSSRDTLDEDITSSLNLPLALKKSISRAMFQHPGPKLAATISTIDIMPPQVFPPWKTGITGGRTARAIVIQSNRDLSRFSVLCCDRDREGILFFVAPGTKTIRQGHVTPRPFWSNVIKTKQTHVVRSSLKSKAIQLPPITQPPNIK